MAILVVVYEVLCAIFVTFRAWQAMRIRNGAKLDRNQLEYLILQQGSSPVLLRFHTNEHFLLQEFFTFGIYVSFL